MIYAGLGFYFLAFMGYLASLRKAGFWFSFCGFLILLTGWFVRWNQVDHIPMQNMFEVFLTLGMAILPISLFCRSFLKIDTFPALAGDCLLGVIVLFPAGFKFTDQPQPLPPALQSWLFGPHVAVYMLSYVILAKAALQSVLGLADPLDARQTKTYLLIRLGFPFLTLGLLLGSVWGQMAWGRWWGWDPKELWSLVCWLVYAMYFHLRYFFSKPARIRLLDLFFAMLGLLCIIITLLWVNLSQIFEGLHNYAG